MNDIPRHKLREILVRHGRNVGEDARLCQALLTDYCPEHRGENYLLVSVVRERLVMDMATSFRDIKEFPVLLSRLAKRMETNLMVAPPAARWALLAWAEALELVPPDTLVLDDSSPAAVAAGAGNPARQPITGPPRPPGQLLRQAPMVAPDPGYIPNAAAAAAQAATHHMGTGRLPNINVAAAGAAGRVAVSPFRSPAGASGPLVLPKGFVAPAASPAAPLQGGTGPAGTIIRGTGPLPVNVPPSPVQAGIGIGGGPGGVPQVINTRGGDYDLVVSKSGLGDFDTIEAAINAALPGNTIMVQAGVYNETLVIRRALALVADISTGQVIINSDGTCLDMQADNISLTGFTIQAYSDSGSAPQPLVRVQRGRSQLIGCSLGGPCSIVVEVSGGASVAMETCDVFKSSGAGILVRADGFAQLDGCRIQRSTESALHLEPRSRANISRSRIEKAGQYGIRAEADSLIVATGCEITGHMCACVYLNRAGPAQFDACQIGAGQSFGILIDGASATLDGTIISECKQAGISLNKGARVDATGMQVIDNREEGIVACGRSTLGLVKCVVQRQAQYGVYISEGSELEMESCTLGQNGGAGVAVYNSRLELQSTTVVGNKCGGIVLHQESTMAMRDSSLSGNVGTSLLVSTSCVASVERVRIGDGNGDGIFVERDGQITAVSSYISRQSGHGTAGNAASLNLSVVEITGNAGCGVYLAGRTTLQAERCIIRENLQVGVKAEWGAGGAMHQCEVENNSMGNIEKPFFSSLRVEV